MHGQAKSLNSCLRACITTQLEAWLGRSFNSRAPGLSLPYFAWLVFDLFLTCSLFPAFMLEVCLICFYVACRVFALSRFAWLMIDLCLKCSWLAPSCAWLGLELCLTCPYFAELLVLTCAWLVSRFAWLGLDLCLTCHYFAWLGLGLRLNCAWLALNFAWLALDLLLTCAWLDLILLY